MGGLIVKFGGCMSIVNENEEVKVEELPFEKALEQLEEVVQSLEIGELSLDQAIENYRLGMKLAKVCREKLTDAEQKVEKVLADEKTTEFEAFDVEDV